MTNIFTKRSLRTLILAGAAVLAVAAAALAYYLLAPSGYLSLDVNPSIEIRTNRLDQVVAVTGANEDGKALLEGYRLTDRDLDDVIEDLVDRMILQGYLGDGKTNDVLITVDDDTVSAKTLDRVNAKVEDYVAYRNLTANVLSQKIDVSDDLLETASQHHVSAGKMAVIDRLVQRDSSLSPEDFADIRISDLVSYAKEKNISLELLEDRLDDLADRTRDNKTLEQLEDKLDDADDRYDDDLDDRYDDDLDDRYDDDLDDRYDDDLDDRYDDDDRDDWDDRDDD